MAASAGRQVTVNWGNTSPPTDIGGVKEKGIELSGEAIDITSDDSAGWRQLLTLPAQNEVNISLSGVSTDDVLKSAWFSGDRSEEVAIEFANGARIEGTFWLASFSETGTFNEATMFEAELQSSGVVTFTPAA